MKALPALNKRAWLPWSFTLLFALAWIGTSLAQTGYAPRAGGGTEADPVFIAAKSSDGTIASPSNSTWLTSQAVKTYAASKGMAGYDSIRTHGANIPSASTLDLDAVTGDMVLVTGTTAITSIVLSEGRERTVIFNQSLTLVHTGNTINLPSGGSNIITQANDMAIFRGIGGGNVTCVIYQRWNGDSVVPISFGQGLSPASDVEFSSLKTTNILDHFNNTSINPDTRQLQSSGNTVLDWSDPDGHVAITFKDDSSAPSNTATPVGWIKINVNGTDSFFRYYQ